MNHIIVCLWVVRISEKEVCSAADELFISPSLKCHEPHFVCRYTNVFRAIVQDQQQLCVLFFVRFTIDYSLFVTLQKMKMLLRVAAAAVVALNRTEVVFFIKNGCWRGYNSTLCTQTGTNITSTSSLNTWFIHFWQKAGIVIYLFLPVSHLHSINNQPLFTM